MNLENAQPLISICIPTYNRSEKLKRLMEVLLTLKKAHEETIEICVSNNCSTDDTADVIAEWRDVLNIKDITQDTNIGCMRNCVKVTSISSGKWVLMMGDDDSINTSNFSQLLENLKTTDASWVFCGVGDQSGNEYLLGDLIDGYYTKEAMKKEMLRTGLYRFGFVGMHVFKGELRDVFADLTISQIESWPHIGLLMQQISNDGKYLVFNSPIVIQAPNENELYWHMGDWIKVNVCKIKIIAEAFKKRKTYFIFHIRLILREFYSYRNFKELTMWKILEPKSFYKDSLITYLKIYNLFSWFFILSLGHLVLLLILHLVPNPILKLALISLKKDSFLRIYSDIKNDPKYESGVHRGL